MYFIQKVINNANVLPANRVISDGIRSYSYADLLFFVEKLSDNLKIKHFQVGDHCIVIATNSIEFICLYLALHKLGIAVIILPRDCKSSTISYIQGVINVRFVFESNWISENFPLGKIDLPDENKTFKIPDLNGNTLSEILFTSGTTGKPKGILLTHKNIQASIENINSVLGNDQSDSELIFMPLGHSFGLARLRCALYVGSSIIVTEGLNKPKEFFTILRNYKITGLGLVPSAWKYLQKFGFEKIKHYFSNFRFIELGSAPMTADEKKNMGMLLPYVRIKMHYGLTEASRSCFLCFANDNLYLDSVGKASPMAKIGIFSKNGEMLPPNIVGEIGVKGAFVTQNVIADLPTHLFFYGDYYRTGDLGYLNHQGYLFLTGRIADVINVGGKKVVPSEVESVLKMNPSIAEVYCAGIPDPEGLSGEIVLAFAQANDPLFTPEISYFLESLIENLEHHKIPKKIIWVNEFPMTENGKIKRNLLKSLT